MELGSGGASKTAVELTDPVVVLNERQRIFVDVVAKGGTPISAARAAGYSDPHANAYVILKREKIQNAIKFLHKKYESVSDMSRKKVMEGFLEAIEMAKLQGESGVMVSGWRELGRMCGYYAPEQKKIDINITAKRVIDKMETLSDNELARMIEESTAYIEGEVDSDAG